MATVFLMCRLALPFLLLGLVGCTSVFFHPQREHVLTPDRLGLQYSDVYIPSSDHVTLHAWFLPAEGKALGTVLFLHGNAENISTHIASVYWLPEYGFNVLLLDYRGYGASQGRPKLQGLHDDIEHALAYVFERLDADRVMVFGQSLGGAIAIYTLAHSAWRERVKALVVEGAFSSYRDITREKLSQSWLSRPFQWPLSLLINEAYSPIEAISYISPIPLLIVHGDQDRIVPVHHAYRLHKQAKSPKQLWVVPGFGHIQAFREPDYRGRLVAYFREVMGTNGD